MAKRGESSNPEQWDPHKGLGGQADHDRHASDERCGRNPFVGPEPGDQGHGLHDVKGGKMGHAEIAAGG